MCEGMAGDNLILNDKAVTRGCHANNVVWGPNVRKMRAVNKVAKVPRIRWGSRSRLLVGRHCSASDDAVDGPGGGCNDRGSG